MDYHKNMKTYFNSKMRLFRHLLKKNSTIITDEENNEFKTIKNIAIPEKLVYSRKDIESLLVNTEKSHWSATHFRF